MNASEEKTKQERIYTVKGIPVSAYLSETGDFRWIPASPACNCKEKAQEFLEVLKKMPEDRQRVWASRLDTEQAKITCPVINQDASLCKEFDEICATYNKPRLKQAEETKGGESPDE